MNMQDDLPDGDLAYKDAIFLSPHKFIGGPGTPGILIAKKHLFQNRVPASPGGGTVAYVNPERHRYLEDVVHREEGGTHCHCGIHPCWPCLQLKEAVGPKSFKSENITSFDAQSIAGHRIQTSKY